MTALALQVRDRSFRMVLGGYDPSAVQAALESAATEIERVRGDIAHLQEQHAEALAEIERIDGLERSLVRACVAAEEDAQIRSAAARRYAARLVAAAQHEAAARLEAPARERDRLHREVEEIRRATGRAADALEQLIAALHDAASAKVDPVGATAPPIDDGRPASDSGEVEPALAADPGARIEESPGHPADARPRPANSPAARHEPKAARAEVAGVGSPSTRHTSGRRGPRMTLAAGAAAAVLLVFQGSASAPPSRHGAPDLVAAGMAPVTASEANPSEPAVSREAQPDERAAPRAGTTGDASATGGLTMRIKPLRRCWVRVVVDDRTDARELVKGEDIQLDAKRAILLRVGDAGALSIEVNGRVLPPLGADGQVVERRFSAEIN